MRVARFITTLALLCSACTCGDVRAGDVPFDDHWRFALGDSNDARSPTFDDSAWEAVELPHDWSIAGPVAQDNPSTHAGGFLPTGIGWYRKSFDVPAEWSGRQIAIEFDGSYMSTEVYLNGQKIGEHASGFSPFEVNLTPHLKLGEQNVIAVRIDNSRQPNARWYTGSGIYRHVRLAVRDPIHLTRFGAFVTTPEVSERAATVELALEVFNASDAADASFSCATQIYRAGPDGKTTGDAVAAFEAVTGRFNAKGTSARVTSRAILPNPKRWSPDSPTLYVAVTTLSSGGRDVDVRSTVFGVRTIAVSAEKGLLLNGNPVELYGACVHEDNGPLGVAALDRAIVRRVELLKQAGFNAVRCAHNPPAPAFLDACDRLGLLVIDEAFDTWSLAKNRGDFGHHFNELWRDELDRMIVRDRNHPSVIIWSLGNEIIFWSAPIERSIADGTKLVERAKELDPTRFVTTAIAGWNLPDKPWSDIAPLLSKMDIVGYNYAAHRYVSDHRQFPQRVIVGTESFPRDLFAAYDASDRLSHVIGDFVWTGIDYLGESGIGQYVHPDKPAYFHLDPRQFPYHGAYCGDIDLTGFRKPISYARNIAWGRGETLYTSVVETTPDGRKMKLTDWAVDPSQASWTWPGREGQPMEVQVYSRHDKVRLYLNDQLIGEQPTTRTERFVAVFKVPYQAGTLTTIGLDNGSEVERNELRTAGPAAGLRLSADRAEINADGQDLAFLNVEAIDAAGAVQPTADQNVTFSIEGPATIAGVASGDFSTLESYQGNERRLFHGRAQVVIRASHSAGTANVRATANGLTSAEVKIVLR